MGEYVSGGLSGCYSEGCGGCVSVHVFHFILKFTLLSILLLLPSVSNKGSHIHELPQGRGEGLAGVCGRARVRAP